MQEKTECIPAIRFTEFTDAWASGRLGDFFTSSREKGVDGLPTLSVTLDRGLVNRDELERKQETTITATEHLWVRSGDIAYNMMRMWQGAFGRATYDGLTSPAYVVARSKKGNDTRYFEYAFRKSRSIYLFWAYSYGLTSDRLRLYAKDFERIPFAAPRLNEQQKIADFLTAVDARIGQLAQKKALLEDYKKGVMQQLFSQAIRFKDDDGTDYPDWEEKTFYELLDSVLDFRGRTPLKLGLEWGGGDVISLSANNVKNGFIDFSAECNLGSNELFERWMGDVNLRKGDIVFTMEAPLGNVLMLPDNRKYILSQRVVAFKTKSFVLQGFLLQIMWSAGFQSQLARLATGSTAKGINQKSLKKVVTSIPSLGEQTKIANFLSAIDDKIQSVAKQIDETKTFKKGLLQQMFV